MVIRKFWNNKPCEGTDYTKFGDATIPGQEQSVMEILRMYTSGVQVSTKKPMFFGDVLVPQGFNGELSTIDAFELYERVENEWLESGREAVGETEMPPRGVEPSQSSNEHDGISPSTSGVQSSHTPATEQ